jgi:ankyrin repeat protein
MDFLESKHTLESFELGLRDLPQTPSGVYKMAMERILGQEDDFKRQLAVMALTWLVFAERPLKLPELIQALGVNIDDKSLPEERLVTGDTLTSSCAGVLVIDQATEGVRLAHYTVKQYLKDNEASIFKYAQSNMAGVCLVYLSFDEFSHVPETEEEISDRQKKYPFLSYAANYWGYHVACGVEDKVYSLAYNFLSKKHNLKSSLQAMNDFRFRFEADVTGLHLATYFGLNKLATELLKRGVDVNKTTQRGETALHWAVSYGRAEFVQLLVDQYADLDIRNIDGKTALQKAIVNDDLKFVNTLLSSKPKPNLELEDSQGWTPLTWSSASGKTAMVKVLLTSGAKVNGQDRDGWSALHSAASKISKGFKGHQRVINLLIKYEVSVEKPDGTKWTMLKWAAQEGLEDRIRDLIGKGVNLDAVDDEGLTALHWAISYRHETTAWLLIRHKANINISDNKGYTPLHLAVEMGHSSLIWLLLENGAGVNVATKFGKTALHLASTGGHTSVVWLLLEKGANLEYVDNNGLTALHDAVTEGHQSVARILIERVEDLVNVQDDEKQTALHFAASTGNLDLTLLLLEHKATIDWQDIEGYTPLHRAVCQHHEEVVFCLVKKGANVHITDVNGLTALDTAKSARNSNIKFILISQERLLSEN